jgi:adenine phosphoribosyltransferase
VVSRNQGNRYRIIKYRLLVAEALRLAKRFFSYRELSRITGIPEGMLSRYVSGQVIPSLEQAERIWSALERALDPRRIVADRIRELGGLVDLTPVLTDPLHLRLISIYFYNRLSGLNITRILVPETSGITLATALSLVFDVPLVIARRSKDNPYEEYVEGVYVEPPSNYIVFYVPRNTMTRGDRILIVDDIVQTGRTLSALKKIVEHVGAKITAVAALVVVGDEWRRRAGIDRVEALVTISKP